MSGAQAEAPAAPAEAPKGFGQRMAEARAKARANGTYGKNAAPRPGRKQGNRKAAQGSAPRDERPAFLRDDPPAPGERAQPAPEVSAELAQKAKIELATAYAGAHFIAAWATNIRELQVAQAEAEEVATRFQHMMAEWGYPVDELMAGRVGATLNFAIVFGMIEAQKIAIFNHVMGQRMATARGAQAQPPQSDPASQPAPEAAPVATDVDAAARPVADVPTMGDPFARAAE